MARTMKGCVIAMVACTACTSGEELYAQGQAADHAGTRAQALGLYLKACDKNVAAACNDASALLTAGDEVAVDAPRALGLLRKACGGGDLLACANVAPQLRAQKNLDEAIETAGRACSGKVAKGCTVLALIAGDGVSPKLPPSEEVKYLEKAAHLGDPHAKTLLAAKLVHDGGDLARAEVLLREGCAKDATACAILGHLYDGLGGYPKDAAKALAAFESGCAAEAYECNELASQLAESDPTRAHALYTRACDADNGTACLNLGSRYAVGDGVTKDEARARKLYAQACDGDEPKGCVALGRALSKDGKADEARRLFQRACEAKEEDGCEAISAAAEGP